MAFVASSGEELGVHVALDTLDAKGLHKLLDSQGDRFMIPCRTSFSSPVQGWSASFLSSFNHAGQSG